MNYSNFIGERNAVGAFGSGLGDMQGLSGGMANALTTRKVGTVVEALGSIEKRLNGLVSCLTESQASLVGPCSLGDEEAKNPVESIGASLQRISAQLDLATSISHSIREQLQR